MSFENPRNQESQDKKINNSLQFLLEPMVNLGERIKELKDEVEPMLDPSVRNDNRPKIIMAKDILIELEELRTQMANKINTLNNLGKEI